jgi:putative MFS transporter
MIPLNSNIKSFKTKKVSSSKTITENLMQQTIDLFLSKTLPNNYYKDLCFSLILLFMADGAEMLILALTIEGISKEFDLTLSEKSLLASNVFLGLLIGALIALKINLDYGRKKIIQVSNIFVIIFSIFSAISNTFILVNLTRILMGVSIGVIIPTATSLISESIPIENRSFYLNNVWVSASFGEIYVYFLCYILNLDEFSENWRWLLFCSSIPTIISFFLMFKLYESIRYLFLKEHNEEGFNILNELGKPKNLILTDFEKLMIIDDFKEKIKSLKENESNIMSLFDEEFKDTSIKLWIISFVNAFILYSGLYIFPRILQMSNKNEYKNKGFNLYIDLIITSLMYMPTTFIASHLSDIPLFGRKNTLALGFFLSLIISFYCLIVSNVSFISYSLLRFGIGISFSILGVYTSEIYPTRIRTIGNSAVNLLSRASGFFAPFIMEYFFENLGYNSPFIIFLIFSLIGFVLSLSLVVDTYKKALDFNIKNKYEYEMENF